jgi:hypothetical protein
MRIVLRLAKFTDLVPVPANVEITQAAIDAGTLVPGRSKGEWRVRVTKEPPGGTHKIILISEQAIIEKIVSEKADVRRAGRTFSRREAVAHVVMDHHLGDVTDWAWITGVEVHDDGPDEAAFRAHVEPLTRIAHGKRRGQMLVPPEHLADHLAKYTEVATADDHKSHLAVHFNIGA